MAAVPAPNNQVTATGQPQIDAASLAQLAFVLNNYIKANQDAGAANNARNDMSQGLTDRTNAVSGMADNYGALIQALSQRLSASPGGDLEFLRNRAAQINSSLNSSIDRAGAQAMSTGFASALKRGMGNSTQAEDQATNLARKLSDMYVKADESAQQRAFDEMIKDRTLTNQTFGTATQGAAYMNNIALTNARQMYENAAKTASAANKGVGDNLGNVLSSGAGKWLQNKADGYIKSKGGFEGLLMSLRNAIDGTPAETPVAMSGGDQRAFAGSEDDATDGGYWASQPAQPAQASAPQWDQTWLQGDSGYNYEEEPQTFGPSMNGQSDLADFWG